jgi:hypothetical protein
MPRIRNRFPAARPIWGQLGEFAQGFLGLAQVCSFCGGCRQQFSVTVGTVFEPSKVPLHTWVLAALLLYSSPKGLSSHQLPRILGTTCKTAWFLTHRSRAAMKADNPGRFGENNPVKTDKTFVGTEPGVMKCRSYSHNNAVGEVSPNLPFLKEFTKKVDTAWAGGPSD